jgi:hypothetical protein
MFSRDSCYFFVRPKRSFLELAVFLGRAVKAPQIRRVERKSKTKLAHILHVRHRDEVEPPITDWLREAYALPDSRNRQETRREPRSGRKSTPGRKSRPRSTSGSRRQRRS